MSTRKGHNPPLPDSETERRQQTAFERDYADKEPRPPEGDSGSPVDVPTEPPDEPNPIHFREWL